MDFRNRITNAIKGFRTNSWNTPTGTELARRFRKYGNEKAYADWSQVVMDEPDKYTGYLYAAVRNRANKSVIMGRNHIYTTAKKSVMEQVKGTDDVLYHPYLELIDTSLDFANRQFWYQISTFLDLKGRYYLMVVRNTSRLNGQMGSVQSFKLLNPYNIRRVFNNKTMKLEGYVEGRDGKTRNINKDMIIEIDSFNPFSDDEPYSMTDAASDSQFTMKTSADHTRASVQKNRATAGIVTINDDDLALDDEKIKNFKARVTGKVKGEPIFGIGKGSITYDDMQIDLNKSAVKDVNEVTLKTLIAVTGNSKTVFGIEESGVTRDTSGDQKAMFVSDHVIPQVELILDALNQDYKNAYPKDYEDFKYEMRVEDPSEDSTDSEIKLQELKTKELETYSTLRNKGYSHEVSAKYASGDMELIELGEPDEEVEVVPPVPENEQTESENKHTRHLQAIHNLFDQEEQGVLSAQQGSLENAVQNIERTATAMVMKKVVKNQYETVEDIITKSDRKELEKELQNNLETFYLIVLPLFAKRIINKRRQEFGRNGNFSTNQSVKKYIKDISVKGATGHIDTVLGDLFKAVQEMALTGASQQEMINAITAKYTQIAKNRAKTIARTETNRAFTQSQYQADLQFLKQNDLTSRAYKKWITTSDDPCPMCLEMASRPPVPFKDDFVEFGSELIVTYEENDKTKVLKQKIDYEPLEAGNLHVNCGCKYQLIIE